jgi:monothiol bacilliredoxin
MDWKTLDTVSKIDTITEASRIVPCLIFKHSSSCSLSFIAKYRLEEDWDIPADAIQPFFLDAMAHRPVAKAVAERFAVPHESPQVLLIWQGECVFDDSHLDISVAALAEFMAENALALA